MKLSAVELDGVVKSPQGSASPELPERRLGKLLLERGTLSLADVERIAQLQAEKGVRFGEAAIALGLLTEPELQRALAEQFDYPYLLPGEGGFSPELIAAYQPFTPQVEALRGLRTQLQLRWFRATPPHRGLAVISPRRAEGKSYTAANLAVVFSQLGQRTLLIDCDLRHSRQHAIFGADNREGLSTLLSGRSKQIVQKIHGLVDLSLITAGPVPPNPQELLERPLFARVAEELAGEYEVILYDTPAGIENADAQRVAAITGGALLVTRPSYTRTRDARRLLEAVEQTGCKVVGAITNDF